MLFLMFFGCFVEFIVLIFLLLKKRKGSFLSYSFLFELSGMFELYFFHLRLKVRNFPIFLHKLYLVLYKISLTNSMVSS